MNGINRLIAERCRDGVIHGELSKFAELVRGTPITKKQITEGTVPVVAGGRTVAYTHGESNRDGETIVIAGSGAYAGFASWWEGPIFVSDAFSIKPIEEFLLPKFCFHWLLSKQDELHRLKRGGGVPHVYAKDVGKLRVPLPPLEVQREIVRILDKFTALEAELEAELEARRRQYEHYRTQALDLSVESNFRWSTLGEISTRVSSGATPKAGAPEYYQGGTIPWLRTGEVNFCDIWETEIHITNTALQRTGTSWIKENCVIVAISGATAAKSAINKIPLTTNQHCCNLQIDPYQADYRYVFHWVSSKYNELKSRGRGARSDLNAKLIKDFSIPIPSLDEQRRIIDFMDRFDSLVNDLSVGLPAELAARRKQYEYYRDKLLTFEEAPA